MNYYQFHIADWALHTSHLSLEEEGVYRRLLDYYYDTESPIPKETQAVIRRLRLRGYEEIVELILEEFFILEDDGWHNRRADKEIEAYQQKAEQARANGRKGGRPKKNNGLESDNPEKTKPVNSGLQEKSSSKANQEPRTKNQEPKDYSSEAVASDVDGGADDSPPPENPKPEKFTPDDYRLAERMAKAVLRVAPKSKTPDIAKWADTIRLMRERDGLTLGEITEVFRFAHNDSFWKTNILSPTKLREQFARLDAQMRIPTNEKRHTTSADRWAIDHDDTSWLTGTPRSGDCIDGELDFPPNADDLHCLEAGRGGRH